MTDVGQAERHEDPEALRVKAEHRQALARIDAEQDASRLAGLPFAARIYFDPVLFDRMNGMAERMADSRGMPKHIQGDSIMALYCIERGWSWGMSPLAVAMGTFKIGDAIGHYGRTIIAAINNSGRLHGSLQFEHFADVSGKTWARVTANFAERQSTKKTDEHGNAVKYLVPAYTRADEEGLGVIVRGHIKGEENPRELRFYLKQAWPRNSTLWATDPATQICYTGARRFSSLYMPDIVAGARMEDDFEPPMRDITAESKALSAAAAASGIDPMDAVVAHARGNGAGEEQRQSERVDQQTDAAAQRTGEAASTASEARSPSAEPSSEQIPTVDWRGKPYQKPGSARSAALKEIAQAKTAGDLSDLAAPVKLLVDGLRKVRSVEFADEVEQEFLAKCDTLAGSGQQATQASEPEHAESVPQDPVATSQPADRDWLPKRLKAIGALASSGHIKLYREKWIAEAKSHGDEAAKQIAEAFDDQAQKVADAARGMG